MGNIRISINKKYLILGIIHAFIGIGAVPAGFMLFSEPDGSLLGLRLDSLSGSPFKDFFIPGLFLFVVNGIFNLVNAVLCLIKYRFAPAFSLLLGSAMIIWLMVQFYFVGLTHFLHPTYFVSGLIEIILAYLLLFPGRSK